MDGYSPHNHRAPSQSMEGVCAIPREGSSAQLSSALPTLPAGCKGLLHRQHPLGIPSDHITAVINSIIGFSFAETARSRWAPSAPCTGLGCRGRGQSPSLHRNVSLLPTGDKDRAALRGSSSPWTMAAGPAAQIPPALSPHTKLCQTTLVSLGTHQPQTRLHQLR